jgi:uncharacterized protein
MSTDLKHALAAYAAALAATIVIVQGGGGIPIVGDHVGALVAVVFLYIPAAYAWRRREDLGSYGFRLAPVRRGLALGFGVPLLVFPLFGVGFVLFYELACHDGAGILGALAGPGMCRGYAGLEGAEVPGFSLGLAELVFVQVVVVAIPEELFFRGFLHEKLERALPAKRTILGGGVGWALIISSALFAIAHLATGLDPRRLAVFFPALLFGWMRSATGSITAGVIAHALSNVFLHLLEQTFL